MNTHSFVEQAPTWPLHAVDPEEQDSPWAIEPPEPIDTLRTWIGSIWGPREGEGRHG